MSNCKGCKAEIRWVKLAATGKALALNLYPDSRAGSVFFLYSAGGWCVASRTARPPHGASLYVPHFATCPNAAQFRKGRARR